MDYVILLLSLFLVLSLIQNVSLYQQRNIYRDGMNEVIKISNKMGQDLTSFIIDLGREPRSPADVFQHPPKWSSNKDQN